MMLCPGFQTRSLQSQPCQFWRRHSQKGGSKVTPRRHRAHISYLSAGYWLHSTSDTVGHSADPSRLSGTYAQGLSLHCLPEALSTGSSQTPKRCFFSGKPTRARGMAQRRSREAVLPPFYQQRAVAALLSAVASLNGIGGN